MPDWDDVYAEKSIGMARPSDVLVSNEHLLPAKGEALDYASGLAGNSFFLAKKNYAVTAWDLSEVAVEKVNSFAKNKNLNVNAQVCDLENKLPDIKNQFDVVVVSYFLHRDSLRYLYELLKKDGLLFYQTFSGRQYKEQGPSREAFRLKKNELLDVFSDMQLLYYREDNEYSSGPDAKQGQVCFVAKK